MGWPEINNWPDIVSLEHLTQGQIGVLNVLMPIAH